MKQYKHSDPIWQEVYSGLDGFCEHAIKSLILTELFHLPKAEIHSTLKEYIVSGLQTLGNPLEKISGEISIFMVNMEDLFYKAQNSGNISNDADFGDVEHAHMSIEDAIFKEFIKYFKLTD